MTADELFMHAAVRWGLRRQPDGSRRVPAPRVLEVLVVPVHAGACMLIAFRWHADW